MEITEVKIRRMMDEPKMRAIVSVTFDDELVIHDIKIIQGHEKLFLAMPSRRHANGTYSDIAHPTSALLRDKLERAVIEKYLHASSEGLEFQDK
jgi:stage V sporulation protein G